MHDMGFNTQARDILNEMKEKQKEETMKIIKSVLLKGAQTREVIEVLAHINDGGQIKCFKTEASISNKLLAKDLTRRGIPYVLMQYGDNDDIMFVMRDKDEDVLNSVMCSLYIKISIAENSTKEMGRQLIAYMESGGTLAKFYIDEGAAGEFCSTLRSSSIPFATYFDTAAHQYVYVIRDCDKERVANGSSAILNCCKLLKEAVIP